MNHYAIQQTAFPIREEVVCPKPRRVGVLNVVAINDQSQVAPFFCGSPPKRVSNPLVRDVRFGDENIGFVSQQVPSFRNKPAIRIEGGFDSFDRDGRNCRITTLA